MTMSNTIIKERDVVYFVHLHLDTARRLNESARHENEKVYRVEGKPRPMLVMSRLQKRRGRDWFRVLPITSKGKDKTGKLLPDIEYIGDCLNVGRESYVKLDPRDLPENMLSVEDGKSLVVTPCDHFAFANAIKVLERKL